MSHKPEAVAPSTPAAQTATPSASARSHVSLLWVDNANIARCRVVPLTRFQQPSFHVNLTNAIQSMPSMYDAALESPVGNIVLVPDASKVYDISSWMDDASACFGDMKKDGADWEQCPRSFLRRQEQRLREQFHIRATIGFELEFQLLKRHGDDFAPVDSTMYCEVKALQHGSSWQVLKEVVEVLQRDLGITVYQYHPESASGQFEISIGYDPSATPKNATGAASDQPPPLSLVEAVDQLVLARQTIHGIAAKHGLHATFVPKLSVNETGSGAHIHLGLQDLRPQHFFGHNLFATRTDDARAFLAAILAELPGMQVLLAPSVNSYERLRPSCWAGAYVCYGYENREAAIRLIGSNKDEFTRVDHFELKAVDAVANPYLAVGALLAAGMVGLEHDGLSLPEPATQDPATLAEEDRPALLPQSLGEAISTFQARASLWAPVLSESYFSLLNRLREAENQHYSGLTREEMLKQLVNRF